MGLTRTPERQLEEAQRPARLTTHDRRVAPSRQVERSLARLTRFRNAAEVGLHEGTSGEVDRLVLVPAALDGHRIAVVEVTQRLGPGAAEALHVGEAPERPLARRLVATLRREPAYLLEAGARADEVVAPLPDRGEVVDRPLGDPQVPQGRLQRESALDEPLRHALPEEHLVLRLETERLAEDVVPPDPFGQPGSRPRAHDRFPNVFARDAEQLREGKLDPSLEHGILGLPERLPEHGPRHPPVDAEHMEARPIEPSLGTRVPGARDGQGGVDDRAGAGAVGRPQAVLGLGHPALVEAVDVPLGSRLRRPGGELDRCLDRTAVACALGGPVQHRRDRFVGALATQGEVPRLLLQVRDQRREASMHLPAPDRRRVRVHARREQRVDEADPVAVEGNDAGLDRAPEIATARRFDHPDGRLGQRRSDEQGLLRPPREARRSPADQFAHVVWDGELFAGLGHRPRRRRVAGRAQGRRRGSLRDAAWIRRMTRRGNGSPRRSSRRT